jgi:hypothetical protein
VENEQNQLQLDPVQLVGEARTEYKKTSFDKKEKINSLIMGRWNTNDLMSLMESLLLEYTAFFDLHYAPEKIIEDMGLENMLAHLSKSTTDISRYPSRDNLSSDLYMMVRMPTRLRRAALLIGSYIATGKLEEMIRQQDVKPL